MVVPRTVFRICKAHGKVFETNFPIFFQTRSPKSKKTVRSQGLGPCLSTPKNGPNYPSLHLVAPLIPIS